MGANCCCQEGPGKLLLGKKQPQQASRGSLASGTSCDSLATHRTVSGSILPNNSGRTPKDKYDVDIGTVGSGAFGTVRKAVNKKTKSVCALKTIKKDAIPNINAFLNEVEVNIAMDHPNIVRLFETFEDHRHVYLAMEICHGGEMFDEIIKQGYFSEGEAARLMQQILYAVVYMHSRLIAHRDLKPENFLLQEKNVAVGSNTVKIIDFGIAKRFVRNGAEGAACLRTQAGTAYYMAPEVLNGPYNEKCDIWSAGVILYILLSGSPPFTGQDDEHILKAARKGRISFDIEEFDSVSREAKQLILDMCNLDARKRLSAEQVLSSNWFKHAPHTGEKGKSMSEGFVKKLRSFSSVNRFKKAALHLIAHRMDDQQLRKMKETFMRLDKNHDGTLTLQEMKEACSESGLAEVQDAQQIFEQLDYDGSGNIGYTEFLAAMIDQKNYLQEEVCWEAFRIFDRDGNGSIDMKELKQMLTENSEIEEQLNQKTTAEVAQLFKEVDEDGDGKVSFAEFMAMLRR